MQKKKILKNPKTLRFWASEDLCSYDLWLQVWKVYMYNNIIGYYIKTKGKVEKNTVLWRAFDQKRHVTLILNTSAKLNTSVKS